MSRLRIYLLPAFLSVLVHIGLFFASDRLWQRAAPTKSVSRADGEEMLSELEEESLPHGRVLHIVVEKNGVFIGENCLQFDIFDDYLRANSRKLRPDYVIVCGTDLARYGSAMKVYVSARSILKVPTTIDTRPLVVGTRFEPIEVHEHYWEY